MRRPSTLRSWPWPARLSWPATHRGPAQPSDAGPGRPHDHRPPCPRRPPFRSCLPLPDVPSPSAPRPNPSVAGRRRRRAPVTNQLPWSSSTPTSTIESTARPWAVAAQQVPVGCRSTSIARPATRQCAHERERHPRWTYSNPGLVNGGNGVQPRGHREVARLLQLLRRGRWRDVEHLELLHRVAGFVVG